MTDCPKCKHFFYCEFTKQLFYKAIDEPCEEFKEKETDNGTNNESTTVSI